MLRLRRSARVRGRVRHLPAPARRVPGRHGAGPAARAVAPGRRARSCSCCRTRPGPVAPAARWPTIWRRRTPAAPSRSSRRRPSGGYLVSRARAARCRRLGRGVLPQVSHRRRPAHGGGDQSPAERGARQLRDGVRSSSFARRELDHEQHLLQNGPRSTASCGGRSASRSSRSFVAVLFGCRADDRRDRDGARPPVLPAARARRARTAPSCWSAIRAPAPRSCSASSPTRASARGWSCS